MRGTKAKAMRRYVKERFPFLSVTPLYRKHHMSDTQAVLADQCQRALYQNIKASYKKARRLSTTAWRKYNDRIINTSTG